MSARSGFLGRGSVTRSRSSVTPSTKPPGLLMIRPSDSPADVDRSEAGVIAMHQRVDSTLPESAAVIVRNGHAEHPYLQLVFHHPRRKVLLVDPLEDVQQRPARELVQ